MSYGSCRRTVAITSMLAGSVPPLGEALVAGEGRQMSEEAGRDSAPLIILFDNKCQFRGAFGTRPVGRDVTSRSNDYLAPCGFGRHDQRHFAHEIDVDRAIDLGVG